MLSDISAGKPGSWNRLFAVVYRELHALARKSMSKEHPGQTLQTTALVHEAYMRLVRDRKERWQNRSHFFGVAARAMRRIMVDRARTRKRIKRGAGKRPVSLDAANGLSKGCEGCYDLFADLENLDTALTKLGAMPEHQRKCTIVELRFFVGLTHEQTAEVLGVSGITVKRDWEFTRAWLWEEMKEKGSEAF